MLTPVIIAPSFMAITIGEQLGSYEITALLGKGGMGEVYRARDTKLKGVLSYSVLRPLAFRVLRIDVSR